MTKEIINKIRLCCLLTFSLFHVQAYAITAFITKIQNLDFIDVIPVIGNCDINVDTSILSGTSCAGGASPTGDVGHYRITADPGKAITITINSKSDTGDGVIVLPSGKIKTDSAADVVFSADTAVNVNSGVSGEIDIYIAGRLTFTARKSFSTSYSVDIEIEFIE